MAFMGYEESLDQVKRLLGLLPQVQVVDVYEFEPGGADLRLVVRSEDSLARLAYLMGAANTELFVSYEPASWYEGPGAMRFVLTAEPEPYSLSESFLPPTRLQKVGIYLARMLKKMGLLDPEEADRLQRAWNAVPM